MPSLAELLGISEIKDEQTLVPIKPKLTITVHKD